MGSVTIFGTLEVQLFLRSFNILGCTLLVVWALSPLGGQASLRLLDERTHPVQSQKELRYLGSDSSSRLQGASSSESYGFAIDGLYSAALFSPPSAQAASMDLWGNVKIPVLETSEYGNSGPEGWISINPSNATYSSLLGLPIDGMATSGQSTFTVESYYMTLNCPLLDHVQRTTFNWTSVLSEDYLRTQTNNDSSFTHGEWPFGFFVDSKSNFSRHGGLYPNESPLPAAQPYVLFAAQADGGDGATLAHCSLNRSSVESNMTCQDTSCAVTQMRRSKIDRRPSDYTPLYSYSVRLNFWKYWALAAGASLHPNTATPTELFIQNGSLTASLSTLRDAFSEVNLYQLPAHTFSERFSLLWNTYWQCSIAPWYQTGNLPSNLTTFSDQANSSELIANATTASITNLQPVYVSSRPWAIILLVASIVLFICAIYGAIIKYQTVAPDVLGHVSSLTRDNPYVPLPGGGTALDGLERARLLKNMKVRLQDVTPGDAQGHIALTNNEWRNYGKLRTDRLYGGMPQGLRA